MNNSNLRRKVKHKETNFSFDLGLTVLWKPRCTFREFEHHLPHNFRCSSYNPGHSTIYLFYSCGHKHSLGQIPPLSLPLQCCSQGKACWRVVQHCIGGGSEYCRNSAGIPVSNTCCRAWNGDRYSCQCDQNGSTGDQKFSSSRQTGD